MMQNNLDADKVLVIDSVVENIEDLSRDFIFEGHQMFKAVNGYEAISIAEQESPVLGVVDYISKPFHYVI